MVLPVWIKTSFPKPDYLERDGGVLKNNIKSVAHLVSLDEKCLAFRPTLFNKDSRVTEVWFSGDHCNVGGGFKRDGLSDIALEFMMKKSELKTLELDKINFEELNKNKENIKINQNDIEINPSHTGPMPFKKVLLRLVNSKNILDKIAPNNSEIRKKTDEEGLNKIIANSSSAFEPRDFRIDENNNPSNHTPVVYRSVVDRKKDIIKYMPESLRHKTFLVMDENGAIRS